MKCQRLDQRAVRTAICTAMAATLVSGFVSTGAMAAKDMASEQGARHSAASTKSIAKAEKAVAKRPNDAAARAALANAYLMAGRFESAATTFEDARFLGDTSARTALSLALALAGAGNNAAAVELLDDNAQAIPASDYGLALALAGQTTRGVEVLSGALRDGDTSAKLRQNLAYAYALDGRWREARLMAGQDIPADKLDDRISEWAHQGRPEDARLRVAGMLSAPVLEDAGQPQRLALARTPAEIVAAPALAARTERTGELPPVDKGDNFWISEAARPDDQPVAAAVATRAVAVAPPEPIAPVPAPSAESTAAFADAFASVRPQSGFVSRPVVQSVPAARVASASAPRRKSRAVAPVRALVSPIRGSVLSGSHLVQLGSFSSRQNADRAWSIFQTRNPELKSFDKVITRALVNGKTYWRVSAAGFDRGSANRMCSTVRSRGGGCLSFSQAHPLPGALAMKD